MTRFTGKSDSKNKRIYYGDILKITPKREFLIKGEKIKDFVYYAIVTKHDFEKGAFLWEGFIKEPLDFYFNGYYKLEVVGNTENASKEIADKLLIQFEESREALSGILKGDNQDGL